MPFLRIQTNQTLETGQVEALLQEGTRVIVEGLNKPREYVQVLVEGGLSMTFAGDASPTAFVEVRSLGLPGDKVKPLCRALFQLLREQLGLSPERVFINLHDLPRNHWGWNGDTFG